MHIALFLCAQLGELNEQGMGAVSSPLAPGVQLW